MTERPFSLRHGTGHHQCGVVLEGLPVL